MILLQPTDFPKVLPLIDANEIRGYFSHVRSVLQGRQPGKVFADNAGDPKTVIVMHRGGPSFACGVPDSRPFVPDEPDAVLPTAAPWFGAFWTPNVEWRQCLAEMFASPRRRTVFDLPIDARPSPTADAYDRLPVGSVLRRVDIDIARKIATSFDPWSTDIWNGPDGFVRDTAGFCVTHGDDVACLCTACYIGGGAAEISIATGVAYRRRGLARATASALIAWCRKHGLTPNWSCNADNESSVRLAESLGFVKSHDIHGFFYSSTTMAWTDGKWRAK
jgi:GNAT superfamily N-acetyltransferase